jgi:hypothetical protein
MKAFLLMVLDENENDKIYSTSSLAFFQDSIVTPQIRGNFVRHAQMVLEQEPFWSMAGK